MSLDRQTGGVGVGSALDARAAYQVTRTCHKRPAIETFAAITVKSRHNRQIAQARTLTQNKKNQLHNPAVTYRATHRRRYRYSAPICHRTRARFVRRTCDEHRNRVLVVVVPCCLPSHTRKPSGHGVSAHKFGRSLVMVVCAPVLPPRCAR